MRTPDRFLVAGALVVLVASVAIFVVLVVSGADRLGGSDRDDPTTVAIQPGPASPTPASPTSASLPNPPAATAPPTERRPTVCVDVGHGGVDEGNVRLSDDGTEIVAEEKDFTLAQSLELRDRLERQGVRVVLTRETDTEVNADLADVNGDGIGPVDPNGDGEIDPSQGEALDIVDEFQARVDICNDANADLLVSIHVNSSTTLDREGFEAWWAEGNDYSGESRRAAELLITELGREYAAAGYDAVNRGAAPDSTLPTPSEPEKFKNFIILSPDFPPQNYTGAKMPSVIVECLHLSNDDDAAFLVGEAETAQNAIVTAYETAILEYFDLEPDAA